MSVSVAMQEYLAETYRLAHYQGDNPYVSTSSLAEVLGVSAPAVTRMVQRLKDAGYLIHEPYHGIVLTPEGEKEALLSIRRHRLVERFLVDVMQFGWHEVHDAADQLGAVVGNTVVNRMEEMAGYPRRCPHGEPIPSADGIMPKVVDRSLTEVDPQNEFLISRINSHDAEKLQYLGTLGLTPGTHIYLNERAPFEGPLQIKVDNEFHFIGYGLAGVLRVCSEEEYEI